METIGAFDAKTRLSELLERAAKGESFLITKHGHPVARLVGYSHRAGPRTGGYWKGRVRIADDFDAPLPAEVAGPFHGLDR